MKKILDTISMIDQALDTKRKRHIIGGVLLSVSIFFGVLSVTALSTKMEDAL